MCVCRLTVQDPEFWKGLQPVAFGPLPRLQSQVTVIGYPCEPLPSPTFQQYQAPALLLNCMGCTVLKAVNLLRMTGPVLGHLFASRSVALSCDCALTCTARCKRARQRIQ